MRVAVTGGGGRLGRSVVGTLAERGHEVISVDRQVFDDLPAHRQIVADLRDNEQAVRAITEAAPEALVHLAAIAVPFSAPEDVIMRTNVTMAFQTTQAAVDLQVPRILLASSPTPIGYGAPLGWRPDYLPIDERHPLRPWNGYALSKQVIESMVAMFTHQRGDQVRLSAFRPCFVVSPAEWQGAPTQQGHTIHERLANPDLAAVSLFNYVDARDAADFVDVWLSAAGELPNGEVFFVGAADALARESLSTLIPRYLPGTEELAAGLTGSTPAFTTAKAEGMLGWRPTRSWRTELMDDDQLIPAAN